MSLSHVNQYRRVSCLLFVFLIIFLPLLFSNCSNNNPFSIKSNRNTSDSRIATTEAIHVIYQTHDGYYGWAPEVTDLGDYAGNYGQSVDCIKAHLTNGDIFYKVHCKGSSNWLDEVINRNDINADGYAGIYNSPIDGLMMRTNTNQTIHYRVHVKGSDWLPWVTGYDENDWENGYAGNLGQEIDAIQIYLDGSANSNNVVNPNNTNISIQSSFTTTEAIHIIYQTHDGYYGWAPEVTDLKDYAGNYGQSVDCIKAHLTYGDIFYKVHCKGSSYWLDEVINKNDIDADGYAGIYYSPIDGLMMRTNTNQTIHYRVHVNGSDWLPWVTGYDENDWKNGYAGNLGQEIDAVQIYLDGSTNSNNERTQYNQSSGQPTLQQGSSGEAVKTLQSALNTLIGANLVVDGDFGPATKAAVMKFQQSNGSAVDGVVGPNTWATIDIKLALKELSRSNQQNDPTISLENLKKIYAAHPGDKMYKHGMTTFYFHSFKDAQEAKAELDNLDAEFCKSKKEKGENFAYEYARNLATLLIPVKIGNVIIQPGVELNAALMAKAMSEANAGGSTNFEAYMDIASSIFSMIEIAGIKLTGIGSFITTIKTYMQILGGDCLLYTWKIEKCPWYISNNRRGYYRLQLILN